MKTFLPYHYYSYPGARPILCELDSDNFVYMSHNDSVLHRKKYGGQFVMLVELHGAQDTQLHTEEQKHVSE